MSFFCWGYVGKKRLGGNHCCRAYSVSSICVVVELGTILSAKLNGAAYTKCYELTKFRHL
jgi:hypothetical protein